MGKTDKSLVQILIDAGYAEGTAQQWSNIMVGIKPHLQNTIEWMKRHREKVQERMEKTLDTAEYKDLVKALDTLTYNIQLLGGRPTQNIAISLEVRQRIEALIDE